MTPIRRGAPPPLARQAGALVMYSSAICAWRRNPHSFLGEPVQELCAIRHAAPDHDAARRACLAEALRRWPISEGWRAHQVVSLADDEADQAAAGRQSDSEHSIMRERAPLPLPSTGAHKSKKGENFIMLRLSSALRWAR